MYNRSSSSNRGEMQSITSKRRYSAFTTIMISSWYTAVSTALVRTSQITQLVSITYLLTPWSRVLLKKLTGSAASQEISHILWNPKVHYRTHKYPPPAPILSQLHPVPTIPSYFLKIHLNIILPSMAGSPQWSLSLRFPNQYPVHTSPLPHTRHMPRPSHSSRFFHPHKFC